MVSAAHILMFSIAMCSTNDTCGPCNRPNYSNGFIFPSDKASSDIVRVLSYNVRGESLLDCEHGNSWEQRRFKIKYLIDCYHPDILGFQGVKRNYIADLCSMFSAYTLLFVDIPEKDQDVVVLVRQDRFDVKDDFYIWITDDPLCEAMPSRPPWGGRSQRLIIVADLHDKTTKKNVVLFCTHFDSTGIDSRINSARALVAQQIKCAQNFPAIVCGDFNFITTSTFPSAAQKNEDAYVTLASCLYDVRDIVSGGHYGADGTWIGWPYDKYAAPRGTVGERLDHIFVKKCSVIREGVLNFKVDDGANRLICPTHLAFHDHLYPSDHLPVIADIVID